MARTIRRQSTKEARVYYPTKRGRKADVRRQRQQTRRELESYR